MAGHNLLKKDNQAFTISISKPRSKRNLAIAAKINK
jgi:hypothetical protein